MPLDIEIDGPVRERASLEAMLDAEVALRELTEVRSVTSPASMAGQVTRWMGGTYSLPTTDGALSAVLDNEAVAPMLTAPRRRKKRVLLLAIVIAR